MGTLEVKPEWDGLGVKGQMAEGPFTQKPDDVDEPMYFGTTFDVTLNVGGGLGPEQPVTHIGKMPTQVATKETPWIETLCGRWCRASGETINSTECEPCEEVHDAIG